MAPTQNDTKRDSTTEATRAEKGVHVESNETGTDYSIDPENEVTGAKLLLIHLGICLCTFLIGLVKTSPPQEQTFEPLTDSRTLILLQPLSR